MNVTVLLEVSEQSCCAERVERQDIERARARLRVDQSLPPMQRIAQELDRSLAVRGQEALTAVGEGVVHLTLRSKERGHLCKWEILWCFRVVYVK